MKVYFDRTQSPRLARIAAEVLDHLGHGCDWSRNRYPGRDPGDVQWMMDLAAEGGWVAVTGDERITRNPAERAVWRASGLTTFFLLPAWMRAPFEEQAWRLIRWLPRFVELATAERMDTGLAVQWRWHGGSHAGVLTNKNHPSNRQKIQVTIKSYQYDSGSYLGRYRFRPLCV